MAPPVRIRMAAISSFQAIRVKFVTVGINFYHSIVISYILQYNVFLKIISATVSNQWYPWTMSNVQCKLCHNCWTYWKRYGGFKVPSKLC